MIGFLGAGAQARENASYVAPGAVAFHAVSAGFETDGTVEITAPSADQRATSVVAAVGAPGLRRRLVALWPGTSYATVIAPTATVHDGAVLGPGTVIASGAVIAVDVRVGKHVLVNIGATLSHDVVAGDYVTVSPGAHIGGLTRLGDGVFVGIGATVIDGIDLAPGTVIGAGAVVTRGVGEPNSVLVGNPARLLRVAADWLHDL